LQPSLPARLLGTVEVGPITINGQSVSLAESTDAWANALPRALA
jgi:hypothetical protein